MVEIVYWNPSRPPRWANRLRLPGAAKKRLARPVNNFGDLLGPVVVAGMLRRHGLSADDGNARLATVGSILHLTATGDTVWGSGRNGKISEDLHRFDSLDVRAVRGPETARWLEEQRGVATPPVYGDPALLLPDLMPELSELSNDKRHDVTHVPNLNDFHRVRRTPNTINPRTPLDRVLRRIVQSRLVVGSSLHAVIVAEAFGIPARAMTSSTESPLKYQDHYNGTGRDTFAMAESYEEAIELGGEQRPDWDPEPLRQAFPVGLFR